MTNEEANHDTDYEELEAFLSTPGLGLFGEVFFQSVEREPSEFFFGFVGFQLGGCLGTPFSPLLGRLDLVPRPALFCPRHTSDGSSFTPVSYAGIKAGYHDRLLQVYPVAVRGYDGQELAASTRYQQNPRAIHWISIRGWPVRSC